MVTFEQARQIVDDAVRKSYPPGNFYVAAYGWEDDTDFVIVAGTYGDTHTDGDVDDVTMDAPIRVVSKQSGKLRQLYGPDAFAYRNRMVGMSPIGDVPVSLD